MSYGEGTASVKLAWDPNPESDKIINYTLHWGVTSGNYTNQIHVGVATSATVTGLSKVATYYFAVTASNVKATSAYSSEVSSKYSPPIKQPVLPPYKIAANSLKVSPDGQVELDVQGKLGGYCTVQTSYDLRTWHYLTELSFDVEEVIKIVVQPPKDKPDKQFFRIMWEDED